jgi:L-2-hydroxycarboxylate dehydrogenase (NAD+)
MNENNDTVNADKLTEFTAAALGKMGVPDEDARITAKILVEADLRGIDSHGVAHLAPFYIKRIRDGLINVKPDIKIIRDTESTALMDGDKGLGFVVGYRAMQDAMSRAEKTGAGFVTVRNSTHYGAGAYYAMMALPRDMIGTSLTQGGRGVVAPGSRGRGVGLNVISVAVPAGKEAPFVLDMATGVVANGKLEIAARNGLPIPEGWAVDIDNNTVTDVKKVTGGILPLGGATDTGAYKGFGLTVLVDILCSVLSGTFTVPEMDRELSMRGISSHFFGALNISAFMPIEEFKTRMDEMIKAHHDLPKAEGVERITLAGELEKETEIRRRREGIPLHPEVIKSLKELAEELGTDYEL